MIADGYSLIHKGHRARIRDKFARFGADVFSSHELLELLLFYMIPVRDTNPISHMLLSRFGTIGGVLSAGKDELMQVDGVGSATADALLSFANSLDLSYLRPMSKIIQFSKYETVGKFFTEKYRGATSEYVSAALLDNDLRLIRYIKVFDGKFLSPSLKARSIIVPAIQHRASCVLLAHNHVRRSAVASIEETRVSQILRSELAAANVTNGYSAVIISSARSADFSQQRFFGLTRSNFRKRTDCFLPCTRSNRFESFNSHYLSTSVRTSSRRT